MKAKKLNSNDWNCEPGTYYIKPNGHIVCTLPNGDNFMTDHPGGKWTVQNAEDENLVTVTPSINVVGRWHGHLINGEFKN